jgi:hypothetical protein
MGRLTLVVCVALSGAALAPAALAGQPEACPAATCASGVSVAFDAATIRRLPKGTTATICMGRRCRRFAAGGSGVGISDSRLHGRRTVRVRFVVRSRRGKTIFRAIQRVRLKRIRSGGERCEPICWIARLVFKGAHRLVRAPS